MEVDKILRLLHEIKLGRLENMVLITDEPKIPGYLCFPADEVSKKFDTNNVFGQGFDTNRTKAQIKAMAEFLERLCLSNPNKERFVKCNYDNTSKFIDPAAFFCYSEEQVTNRSSILEGLRLGKYDWLVAKNLTTNENCLVPTQLVFLCDGFNELSIRKESISTGAAVGLIDSNHALINGFMESIERDACIYSYLTKRECSQIINLPDESQELVNYLKRYRLYTYIFDITSDLNIPTVFVITLDHSGIGAAVNVGSRSSVTYEEAIKYAILESIQCRRTSRVVKEFQFPEKVPDESEITCLDNRFFYWYPLERINNLNFWLKNQDSVDYEELKQGAISFGQALKSVQSRGYNILVADMTLPELKNGGFEALKVIIPELHPLYLDERAKALYSAHYGSIRNDKNLKPHFFT